MLPKNLFRKYIVKDNKAMILFIFKDFKFNEFGWNTEHYGELLNTKHGANMNILGVPIQVENYKISRQRKKSPSNKYP